MNTDNMSVGGETIDYGPCAFLDNYHPAKKFSSIDHQGRYAFANQGPMGHWNLMRFAETLLPLLGGDSEAAIRLATEELDRFEGIHREELASRFTAKIGIAEYTADDWTLVERLLGLMADGEVDFTLLFRHLGGALESDRDTEVVGLFPETTAMNDWLKQWRARLMNVDRRQAVTLMRQMNPVFIPRNHRVEEAIQAGNQGDFGPFRRLNDLLQKPFAEQAEFAEYEVAPTSDQVVQATFCGT